MTPMQTPARHPKLQPWLDGYFTHSALTNGFTLTELLIATAITSVVVAMAFSGLLVITEADDKAKDQIERRRELNRALDFIADDMQEATLISDVVPPGWTDTPSSPYTPIFYLLKPPTAGGPQQAVGYYIRSASGVVWRGPLVVYRVQPSGAALAARDFPNVGTNGRALVDAVTTTPPSCLPLTGAVVVGRPNVGLKVFIADDQTAKVCLAGQLGDTDILSLETQVFTRGRL